MTKDERLKRWQLDMGLRLNLLALQLPDEIFQANKSTLKQLEDLCLLVTEVKGYEEGEPNE